MIGEDIFRLVHGDTQFQADEAATDRGGAHRLQRARERFGPNTPPEVLQKLGGLSPEEASQFSTRVVAGKTESEAFREDLERRAPSPTAGSLVSKASGDVQFAAVMAEARLANDRTDRVLADAKALNAQLAPQLTLTVNLTGKEEADLPDQIAKEVTKHYEAAVRDAQIVTGARGGSVP